MTTRKVKPVKGKCQRCGACCRNWNFEASILDVAREPRIAVECEKNKVMPGEDPSWMIAISTFQPCPFLRGVPGGLATCEIYANRPDECSLFRPGSKRCHQARREQGIADATPPLTQKGGGE